MAHLIAYIIKKNIDCIYLNEINDLWKKQYPFLDIDEIEEDKVTPRKINKVRQDFIKLLQYRTHSPFLLEKTSKMTTLVGFVILV